MATIKRITNVRSPNRRINFIDWMKAIGIFLIVYGHVASKTIEDLTFPIYPKQLGVAFFVFVMGWYLGQEKRGPVIVIYNRLFPIFLFGIGSALLMSVIVFIAKHDLNESNYLPFLLGVNVLFDYFPANPTTWYIGTYIHLVLIWALILRRFFIRPWMVIAWLGIEIVIRAMMMPHGLYRAYMVVSSWGSVFLIGIFMGQNNKEDTSCNRAILLYLVGYILFILLWNWMTNHFIETSSFPFRQLCYIKSPFRELVCSSFISFLYLTHTLFIFELTRRLPILDMISFFARNTLFIFIIHMPLWYVLGPPLKHIFNSYFLYVCVNVIILFVGLSLASEVIMRKLKPYYLKQVLANRLKLDSWT